MSTVSIHYSDKLELNLDSGCFESIGATTSFSSTCRSGLALAAPEGRDMQSLED